MKHPTPLVTAVLGLLVTVNAEAQRSDPGILPEWATALGSISWVIFDLTCHRLASGL